MPDDALFEVEAMNRWMVGRRSKRFPRMRLLASSLTAGMVMAFGPALAQEAIDPEANKILLAMTDNLKALPALSADYDSDHEIVTLDGQKIQYSASGSMALDRAKGFKVTRKGPFADAELIFDGKDDIALREGMNVYAQLESREPALKKPLRSFGPRPGSTHLARTCWQATLCECSPMRDRGTVVGSALYRRDRCDQRLAFRTDVVDWQIGSARATSRCR